MNNEASLETTNIEPSLIKSPRLARIKHLGLFSVWLAVILWGAYVPEVLPQYPEMSQSITLIFFFLGLANIFLINMKRLNDFNFRGAWLLLGAIPLVGFLGYLLIFFAPGSQVENRYGDKPSYPSRKDYLFILATPLTLLLICFS